jgi:hypothetical protein
MKIVNFKRHEHPLDCHANDGRREVASFDVEFSVGGMQLVWQGWSVRSIRQRQFLQAPAIAKWTSFKIGPAILIKGQDPDVILQMLRLSLFEQYGINSSAPTKKDPKPESNKVSEEKPKKPAAEWTSLIKKKVNK